MISHIGLLTTPANADEHRADLLGPALACGYAQASVQKKGDCTSNLPIRTLASPAAVARLLELIWLPPHLECGSVRFRRFLTRFAALWNTCSSPIATSNRDQGSTPWSGASVSDDDFGKFHRLWPRQVRGLFLSQVRNCDIVARISAAIDIRPLWGDSLASMQRSVAADWESRHRGFSMSAAKKLKKKQLSIAKRYYKTLAKQKKEAKKWSARPRAFGGPVSKTYT